MAYTSVTVEGGLFPADLLERIAEGRAEGQRPVDFGLEGGRRLSDEIQAAFSDARAYWDSYQRRLAHSRESRTTITRQAWVGPLLERFGYTLALQRAGAQVGGDLYPFSHRAGEDPEAPPVHVVASDQPLDRRPEGGRRSPHTLVQEYLNRSDALWGIVTNGERLRLLRDSARLSRPTYLEFDLRALVEGNLYSEFVLLYRLLHRTRLPDGVADAPACWLEKAYQQGLDEGGRVRERLRDGVEAALQELGSAFLAHPASGELRTALREGRVDEGGYYRQLLRLVYRLLFLFVAEERRLVFPEPPASGPEQAELLQRQAVYTKYYSLARLRERCERYTAADDHADLWQGLLETFRLFRDQDAAGQLGLAALDGELFGWQACADLEQTACANGRLLAAIAALSTFRDGRVRRRVNYAALDVEELGSVYESLLDYHPRVDLAARSPFALVAGSERRQTGSYYTPPELVRELIEHALVPVIEERLTAAKTVEDKERALLRLKVCDPASGSGHFLLAAARRIGRELARLRSGEDEPGGEAFRVAVRDVIRSCLYAVDRNPLAVDLCKVALWIEGHCAGLPLSFLDHHVKCGDSLMGVADLAVLEQGLPDDAFKRSDPDQRKLAAALRKRNRAEREQLTLDEAPSLDEHLLDLAVALEGLERTPDDSPRRVAEKAERYEAARGPGSATWDDLTACHLWTAAFFVDLAAWDGPVPTSGTLRAFVANPRAADGRLHGLAWDLASKRRFFHWALEFPEVMLSGGFDVVLGNPPFMGGLKVSDRFGPSHRTYLNCAFAPAAGSADMCALFFRRSCELLRRSGWLGMVATNTIGQGDTREGGLAVIVAVGGSIVFARRFIKWPGVANVEVNLVAIFKGAWKGIPQLDGAGVSRISSRLDSDVEAEPSRLIQNENRSFQGSNALGTGFMLDPHEAERLIRLNPRNKECLFLFLVGEDVNTIVDQSPSRWIINFQDWPLEQAEGYPECMDIVRQKVKPERDRLAGGDATARDRARRWWQFTRPALKLYAIVAPLSRVLVRSRVSEIHAIAFAQKGWVYSEATIVFAFDDDYHFALLQSNLHEAWVRRNASTMRTDVRYTPTDCFETFPFPQAPPDDARDEAARLGAEYHEHRRLTMLARNLGLTKTYNLFHNPACTDADVARLRELHAAMDRAVLACYGWDDLELGHGFHQNERGQTRFTVSPEARRELLRGLLELNLEVAAREVAMGT